MADKVLSKFVDGNGDNYLFRDPTKEATANKVTSIRDASSATDTNYPSEKAVASALTTKIDTITLSVTLPASSTRYVKMATNSGYHHYLCFFNGSMGAYHAEWLFRTYGSGGTARTVVNCIGSFTEHNWYVQGADGTDFYIEFNNTGTSQQTLTFKVASLDGSTLPTLTVVETYPSGYVQLGVAGVNKAQKLTTARTITTDLSSTSAASFDGTANVTPGVTGTLPITSGGTGATTKKGAEYAINGGMSQATAAMADNFQIVFSRVGSDQSATNGVFIYRTALTVWNWIKGKLSSDTGVNISGNAATATDLADNSVLSVEKGGTGKSSVTADSYLKGNGTGVLVERTYAQVRSDLGISAGANKVEASSTNGKIKIDGTDTTVYTHPTTSGNKHIPSGGSSGKFLGWSADGTATWVNNPASGKADSATTLAGYGITDAYTKTETDSLLNGKVQVVTALPSTGTEGVIYYVGPSGSGADQYDEYIWDSTNTQFIKVGEKSIDLSNYLQKTGDGKDVTVTFTAASSRTNVASTDKLSTLFGKVSKWFSDLKALAFKDSITDSDISGTISDSHIASASTWSGKQDALSTQTAYTSKGTATKVPQITTNSLGQVTGITEVTISGVTPASHTHGNIQNGGTLQTTDITVGTGDKLVVTDSSNSDKVARTSIEFDGSTDTQALTKKGTWETFNNYTHPTTSGNKHIPSGGSSGQYLAWDSDGTAKWVSNPNSDTKVKATAKTDNVSYKILATASASPTSGSATEAVYDANITLNPSTHTIAANISGDAATASAAKSGSALETAISGKAASDHVHGNITNDGKIGSTANLPVVTGTSGAVTTGSFATTTVAVATSSAAGTANTFSRGDHKHSISLATGDSAGQVKIAGSNVSVNGWSGKEDSGNKVSAWSATITDTNYPSEKLVKDSLDGKQDSLTTQTAYSAKGTATKVPQITTNSLGQVTGITEVTISGVTPASHTHGNIQNGGTLQSSDVTIGSGDKLVITDYSDSNKVARASASFDGSTTTTALTPKGTFETFLQSHQDISGKEDTSNKVTSWQSTPDDTHYPSEKLVKDTINGKQDALTAQTAYSAKGSGTKVPQITTNSLGQVTGITEVNIEKVYDVVYNSTTYAQIEAAISDGYVLRCKFNDRTGAYYYGEYLGFSGGYYYFVRRINFDNSNATVYRITGDDQWTLFGELNPSITYMTTDQETAIVTELGDL